MLPVGDDAVRCSECHRGVDEFTAIVERWGYWSDGCGELMPFCPECATREFAPDALSSGRLPHVLRRDANKRGVLHDRYTGTTINFVQGPATSGRVQIDHVVALAAAWRTGAKRWRAAKRLFYANDDLVLLAVDGPTNNAKSDKDAAEWLPPNDGFHCRYVARQIAIKTKYELWVTEPERMAMSSVLAGC